MPSDWPVRLIIAISQDDRRLFTEMLEKLVRLSEAFVLRVISRRPLKVSINDGDTAKLYNLRDMTRLIAKRKHLR